MTYTADTIIQSPGTVSAAAIDAWFAAKGPAYQGYAPDGKYKPAPAGLGAAIIAECQRYPDHVVNWDCAAAQILHETAAWQSKYARERNNPGGIGAVNDNPDLAITFASVADGIRAHVAHLLVYAAGDGPWSTDDPRRDAVRRMGWLGTAQTWGGLNGKWAWPGTTYGQGITRLADDLVVFANHGTWGEPMAAQIPGFQWHPADSDHYTKGRKEKIRGGAQHYTAGTNSLNWLSTTSNPPVSVHFLIKHVPTLEDRGWQLVRIEDTAWTTAFANPYTVAIEYEHDGKQSIPDIAYEVMAQTWADITRYVRDHGLGEISVVKGHKEWVNNPTLICPDGIDVARIERRRRELLADPTPPPPDKWILPGNPFGNYGFVSGFRDTVEKLARAKYPEDLNAAALSIVGYPKEDERPQGIGWSVQRCERATLIWDAEADAPFDVVLALTGDR